MVDAPLLRLWSSDYQMILAYAVEKQIASVSSDSCFKEKTKLISNWNKISYLLFKNSKWANIQINGLLKQTGSQFKAKFIWTTPQKKRHLLVIDRIHYWLLRIGLSHVRVIGLRTVAWIHLVLWLTHVDTEIHDNGLLATMSCVLQIASILWMI